MQVPMPEFDSLAPTPIKVEVGIEDMLHIEFEYLKTLYHLKDCIVGKVTFFLVKLRIKSMELCIMRKEVFGTGEAVRNEL